jgi:hypothetical protein
MLKKNEKCIPLGYSTLVVVIECASTVDDVDAFD